MTSTVILSDNGVSSGSAGLKEQGGNDGVLILQTTTSGGTATNALKIDSAQQIATGGATSPTWYATVKGAIQLGSDSKGSLLNADSTVRLANNIYYNAAGSPTQINSGYSSAELLITTTTSDTGAFYFHSSSVGSSSESVILSVSKNVTLALQGGTASFGTGIAFPATQNSSSDVNTLDDYEEGTWTPSLKFGNVEGVTTYGFQNGTYTKVGNTVTVRCYVSITTKSAATGVATLTGLPFATLNAVAHYQTGVIYMGSNSITGAPTGYIAPNTQYVNLGQTNGSVGFVTISNSNFANGGDLMFQGTYITST